MSCFAVVSPDFEIATSMKTILQRVYPRAEMALAAMSAKYTIVTGSCDCSMDSEVFGCVGCSSSPIFYVTPFIPTVCTDYYNRIFNTRLQLDDAGVTAIELVNIYNEYMSNTEILGGDYSPRDYRKCLAEFLTKEPYDD